LDGEKRTFELEYSGEDQQLSIFADAVTIGLTQGLIRLSFFQAMISSELPNPVEGRSKLKAHCIGKMLITRATAKEMRRIIDEALSHEEE
jgi:hypothetical protein